MTFECSAADFANNISKADSVLLIDVRSPGEYRAAHASSAVNIPLDTLNPGLVRTLAKRLELVFICRSGSRSKRACALAPEINTGSIIGGTEAWLSSGLPAEEGKEQIPLERQVRIAAGSLVLLGALLGFSFHPAFFGISAFVGAGLVFAGLTNWCGMAYLLAKMPWNQQ